MLYSCINLLISIIPIPLRFISLDLILIEKIPNIHTKAVEK
ncbi:hypothetical protein LCGC14_1433240 [marine sediment metagenome]|uniref:Uncharacterized protein n=1 Tax=marine sediment metagenome TaxID=412755 RepID=A0A0F9MPS8_9ZZZZ